MENKKKTSTNLQKNKIKISNLSRVITLQSSLCDDNERSQGLLLHVIRQTEIDSFIFQNYYKQFCLIEEVKSRLEYSMAEVASDASLHRDA